MPNICFEEAREACSGWVTSLRPPPNPRVQRTRPCASLRGSPLTRRPLGSPRTDRRFASVVLAVLAAGVLTAQVVRGDEAFLSRAEIKVEEIHHRTTDLEPAVPPSPVPLTTRQVKELRSIFVSALRSNLAAEAKAKGTGSVPAGAGCNTSEYLVTFSWRGDRETAILHVGGKWMSGGSRVGAIFFSESDQQRFTKLFGVQRPCH